MVEYIEREAVCYQLAKQATIDGQPRAIRRSEKIVSDFPAADVQPVVKAHWKPGDIRNVSAVCSNCGHLRLGNGAEWATKLAYFCEKCGADMRPEPPKEE